LNASCPPIVAAISTRRGLDIKIRKLVTLSILIAMGGLDAQVKGPMEGNVNIANGRETLLDVITQLLPWVGFPRPESPE
jgi:4-carboxymuconolactone decarboxylase